MITSIDIAWLAGLVEGEGCISSQKDKYISLTIRMSDQDVIYKAASIMGTRVTGPYKTRDNYKPTWLCQVNGAKAAAWIMTLYALLGSRRKEKAEDVLHLWKKAGSNRPPKPPRAPRGYTTPATCHPELTARANGLCKSCYMKQYRAKHFHTTTQA